MARIPIEMPKLGYDMETGKVGGWLKKVGDQIARGDVIAEIETDKCTVEMEATAVRDPGRDRPGRRRRGARRRDHRLARGRRVGVRSDARPRPGRHPVTPSPMRRAIARRMTESKQQVPHFYLSTEIEMDAAARPAPTATNDGRARDERVTVTAFLLRAVALTLAEHPAFNAVWNGDAVESVDAINIGVAIALDDGLIAPALLDCRRSRRRRARRPAWPISSPGPGPASCAPRRSTRATFTLSQPRACST